MCVGAWMERVRMQMMKSKKKKMKCCCVKTNCVLMFYCCTRCWMIRVKNLTYRRRSQSMRDVMESSDLEMNDVSEMKKTWSCLRR
jgi:hypothetical protein